MAVYIIVAPGYTGRNQTNTKKAPDESEALIFGWVSKYQEINFPTQY